MYTPKDLLTDLSGYGEVLTIRRGPDLLWEHPRDPMAKHVDPPRPESQSSFMGSLYGLVRSNYPLHGGNTPVYRFAEMEHYKSARISAPYGKDHPSYYRGLIADRTPAVKHGWFWTPTRPGLLIDGIPLASMHRYDVRNASAIKRVWNRLDLCFEGVLPRGALIYAGRIAPQSEGTPFLTNNVTYSGGAMQFLMVPYQSCIALKVRYHVDQRVSDRMNELIEFP